MGRHVAGVAYFLIVDLLVVFAQQHLCDQQLAVTSTISFKLWLQDLAKGKGEYETRLFSNFRTVVRNDHRRLLSYVGFSCDFPFRML